jgi:hypothetical protein
MSTFQYMAKAPEDPKDPKDRKRSKDPKKRNSKGYQRDIWEQCLLGISERDVVDASRVDYPKTQLETCYFARPSELTYQIDRAIRTREICMALNKAIYQEKALFELQLEQQEYEAFRKERCSQLGIRDSASWEAIEIWEEILGAQ